MKRPRIAIIDSGVNPRHPHVGSIAGGVTINETSDDPDYLDILGHGTAVTGVIHAAVPDAALIAVRIFQKSLATNIQILTRALDWCASNDIQVINLSLGTTNMQHETAIRAALDRVHLAGAVVVSAWQSAGVPALPGCMEGVVAVAVDQNRTDDDYRVDLTGPKHVFYASPYPRPIPGRPVQHNLQGASFAVAHITGWVARLADGRSSDWEQALIERLVNVQ